MKIGSHRISKYQFLASETNYYAFQKPNCPFNSLLGDQGIGAPTWLLGLTARVIDSNPKYVTMKIST